MLVQANADFAQGWRMHDSEDAMDLLVISAPGLIDFEVESDDERAAGCDNVVSGVLGIRDRLFALPRHMRLTFTGAFERLTFSLCIRLCRRFRFSFGDVQGLCRYRRSDKYSLAVIRFERGQFTSGRSSCGTRSRNTNEVQRSASDCEFARILPLQPNSRFLQLPEALIGNPPGTNGS